MRRQWGHPASHTTHLQKGGRQGDNILRVPRHISKRGRLRTRGSSPQPGRKPGERHGLATHRQHDRLSISAPPSQRQPTQIGLRKTDQAGTTGQREPRHRHQLGALPHRNLGQRESRPSRRLAKPSGPHLRRTHLRYLRRTSSPRKGTQETTPSATRPRDGPSHHLESEGPISLHLDVNQQRPTTGMATPDP